MQAVEDWTLLSDGGAIVTCEKKDMRAPRMGDYHAVTRREKKYGHCAWVIIGVGRSLDSNIILSVFNR